MPLRFATKVQREAASFDALAMAERTAEDNKNAAFLTKDFNKYVAAEDALDAAKAALICFAIAQERAEALIAHGFKLNDLSGRVCSDIFCKPVDPDTALFFFTGDQSGLGPNLKS